MLWKVIEIKTLRGKNSQTINIKNSGVLIWSGLSINYFTWHDYEDRNKDIYSSKWKKIRKCYRIPGWDSQIFLNFVIKWQLQSSQSRQGKEMSERSRRDEFLFPNGPNRGIIVLGWQRATVLPVRRAKAIPTRANIVHPLSPSVKTLLA